MMSDARQILIELIKKCGQEVIDVAEQLVPEFIGRTSIDIHIYYDRTMDVPIISVQNDFVPNKFIEVNKEEDDEDDDDLKILN